MYSNLNEKDIAKAGKIGAWEVSLASAQNGRNSNDDRAAVFSLRDLPSSYTPYLPERFMHNAEEAVQQNHEGKRTGGATFVSGTYDQASGELFLRSRGDSPVYIVAHDGTKSVAIRLTSPVDGVGNHVTNTLKPDNDRAHSAIYRLQPDSEPCMNYDKQHFASLKDDNQKRVYVNSMMKERQALYPESKELDTLDVRLLSQEIADRFALNKSSLQATLVAMSDGVEKRYDIKQAVIDDPFAAHVSRLLRLKHSNPAKALTEYTSDKTDDNATAIVIPLMLEKMPARAYTQSAIFPVGFSLADGHGPSGGIYAHYAVQSTLDELHRLEERYKTLLKEDIDRNPRINEESAEIYKTMIDRGKPEPSKTQMERMVERSMDDSPSRRR